MKKEIVLIARSIKNSQYCIAGREITRSEDNKLRLGKWIRPIGTGVEGAVTATEMFLEGFSFPDFLDIIQIPLSENANNPTQPENWFIKKGKWKKTGKVSTDSVGVLAENPDNLWLSNYSPTDRISSADFTQKGFNSSLYVIRPTSLRLEIGTYYNEFEKREKKKRRAIFDYNGINYDLAITDPEIIKKHFSAFPALDEGVKAAKIQHDKCLLCVSLAPEWKGYHYKLVAKIIEHE